MPLFVAAFFEVLCGWAGYQDSLFVTAFEMLCGRRGTKIGFLWLLLKCFAAGRGTKIRFAHLVPLPAGVTENKESVFH